MNKLVCAFNVVVMIGVLVAPATGTDSAHGVAANPTNMMPLAQYLIADRASEIALARSAAPLAISDKATIQVLGPSGYITAVKGSNGFVCIVERSWMSPFDAAEFWNPRLRGPDCYNPQAAKSVLPMVYRRTGLALRGMSRDQIQAAMNSALDMAQSPRLLPGAMSYMMSKEQHIGPQLSAWRPHLMFYTPEDADWGANAKASPVILTPLIHGAHEPMKMFLVPVLQWSDGSPAPPL